MATTYKIISATDADTLEADVNKAMAEGWEPHGNLLVALLMSPAQRAMAATGRMIADPSLVQPMVRKSRWDVA